MKQKPWERLLVAGKSGLFLLTPGLSIKRWVVLLFLGGGAIILGSAFASQLAVSPRVVGILRTLTFSEFSPIQRGSIFLSIGFLIVGVALWRLAVSMRGLDRYGRRGHFLEDLYVRRVLGAGPRVVAIGGGTGLATLLRGLKHCTSNLTAIVTVADDGGSSGKLRSELGILPPGDIRNCLVALADSEAIIQELMDYQFGDPGTLDGHNFGNLLIAALTLIAGSFEGGVDLASQILAVRGRVLPSTLSSVVLMAETMSQRTLVGESSVGKASEAFKDVYLVPAEVEAFGEAVRAIEEADLTITGPGSLYTSIVPNLLVPGIREAITRSGGVKIYVCNVANQPGETDNFTIGDHVRVVSQFVGPQGIDAVLANNNAPADLLAQYPLLQAESRSYNVQGLPVVWSDVLDLSRPMHHDPQNLAEAIALVYNDRRGHRRHIIKPRSPFP